MSMQNLGATNNEIQGFRIFAPYLHIMHVEIKLILYSSYTKDQRIWLEDERPNEHGTKWISLWNKLISQVLPYTNLAQNFNKFGFKGLGENQILFYWI